jgi:hypothetical protein
MYIFFNAYIIKRLTEKAPKKVPSGQSRPALERYHWKGLDMDINRNRYRFLILILNIWKDFKVLNRFIQKCLQAPASSAHSFV